MVNECEVSRKNMIETKITNENECEVPLENVSDPKIANENECEVPLENVSDPNIAIVNGCEISRKGMIEKNLGLVHSCAHRFKGRGIEYEDLFQAGCIGLIKATKAFDFDRGVKFSTYAVPVILGEMRRLFRDGGAIKISRTIKELSLKISRVRAKYSYDNGREPTISEIATILEAKEEAVAEAIGVCAPPISLTENDENGGGQLDLPVVSPQERTSDMIALKQVLDILDERDRVLIMLRFFGEKTQTQTAERMGMTQVQVSRREKKILAQLRTHLV